MRAGRAWRGSSASAQLRLLDFGTDVKRPHQTTKPLIAKAKAGLVFKMERLGRLTLCQGFAQFRKGCQELRFCTIIGPLAS